MLVTLFRNTSPTRSAFAVFWMPHVGHFAMVFPIRRLPANANV